MKKILISIIFLVLICSTLVNSKPILEEKNMDKGIIDDPKPVDKIFVAFKEAGGDVIWDKQTQELLGLPPFPFFLYLKINEGGWIRTYSGEIYQYPYVRNVICKFFIGDCYPHDRPLQKLKGIAFGLELL